VVAVEVVAVEVMAVVLRRVEMTTVVVNFRVDFRVKKHP
jgi:hypothetical protein